MDEYNIVECVQKLHVPSSNVRVAQESLLTLDMPLVHDTYEPKEIKPANRASSFSPVATGKYSEYHPGANAGTFLWDVLFPSPVKQGRVFFEEEYMLSTPGFILPDKPFEYSLDAYKAVKPITQLLQQTLFFNKYAVLFKVMAMINIPEVKVWAPTIRFQCLSGDGKIVVTRRCRVTVFAPVTGLCSALCSSAGKEDAESVDEPDSGFELVNGD